MNRLPEKYLEFIRLNPGFFSVGNNKVIWDRVKQFPNDRDMLGIIDDLIEAYSLTHQEQLDTGYPFELPEEPEKYLGDFYLGQSETNDPIYLTTNDLNTHILVTGATDSTKTNTVYQIIDSILRSSWG